MDKTRNIGIEVLRSISMCMVVFLHVLNFGVHYLELQPFTPQWFAGWFLEGICYCAVNVYAMISGYVMVNSRRKISRLVSLWIEVLFYSVLSTFLLNIISTESVGKIDFVKAFFPVCSQMFWYFTAYFALFWFVPWLNDLVHNLEFKTFRRLIFRLLIIFGFLPWLADLFGGASAFGLQGGYTAIWLAILYLAGAGIRIYGFDLFSFKKKFHSNLWFFNMAVLSGCMIFLSKVLLTAATLKLFGREIMTAQFYSYLSPFVVMEAVFLLCFFSNVKIERGKWFWIGIGKTTFGIYLIHQTSLFFFVVWPIIEKYRNASFPIFISAMFGSVVLIFAGCSIIEYIRAKLFVVCHIDFFVDRLIAKIKIHR